MGLGVLLALLSLYGTRISAFFLRDAESRYDSIDRLWLRSAMPGLLLVGAALVVSAVIARSVPSSALQAASAASSAGGVTRSLGRQGPGWQTLSAVVPAVVLAVGLALSARLPVSPEARRLAESPKSAPAAIAIAIAPQPVDPACQGAKELGTFCGRVSAIGLSGNGRWLVSLSPGRLAVWDLSTRRVAWETPPAASAAGSEQVLVSNDGAYVILVDHGNVIEFESNKGPFTLPPCESSETRAALAASVAFSPDGSELAVVSRGVCTFAVDTWAPRLQLGADCSGTGVAFTEGGKALWAGCSRDLRRYALPSGKLTCKVKAARVDAASTASLPMPASFEALGSSADGARLFTLGTLSASAEPTPRPNAPIAEVRLSVDRGLWQWNAGTGRPLAFARLQWIWGHPLGPLNRGDWPGSPGNGWPRAAPRGLIPGQQNAGRGLAVWGTEQPQAVWLPSFVAVSNSVRFFELATGRSVHPFSDLESAQLVAASSDASVIAVARRPGIGLGNSTLVVRYPPKQ